MDQQCLNSQFVAQFWAHNQNFQGPSLFESKSNDDETKYGVTAIGCSVGCIVGMGVAVTGIVPARARAGIAISRPIAMAASTEMQNVSNFRCGTQGSRVHAYQFYNMSERCAKARTREINVEFYHSTPYVDSLFNLLQYRIQL